MFEKLMKKQISYCLTQKAILALGLITTAPALTHAAPPPDQLVSQNTIAILTAPDLNELKAVTRQSAQWKIMHDASLKPFKDKFWAGFKSQVLKPFEDEVQFKISNALDLLQGQLTLAISADGALDLDSPDVDFLVILDTGKNQSQLTGILDEARKRMKEGEVSFVDKSIRGARFIQLPVDDQDFDLWLGQSDELLLFSNSEDELEKVIARQKGGSVPSLARNPKFQTQKAALFRDSLVYGWVHLEPLISSAKAKIAAEEQENGPNQMGISPTAVIQALGLNGLVDASFGYQEKPEGSYVEFAVGVPQTQRAGIFKMLASTPNDSAPPPFVPGNVDSFSRWRLDLNRVWADIESMVGRISPLMTGMLQISLSQIGKQTDPNFDFKRNFIGNLGDDLISYSQSPASSSVEDIVAQPGLFLLGARDADQLAAAVNTLLTEFGIQPTSGKFLGRTIYSITTPGGDFDSEAGQVSFVANSGYVAVSSDRSIMEEFLRSGSGDAGSRPLQSNTTLTSAAAKIGGLRTGLFAYQNDRESVKSAYNMIRENPDLMEMFIEEGISEADIVASDWIDLSLLPAFNQIEKYFGITVMTGTVDPVGFHLKVFTPTPPGL